jgi:hypothetical protein
LLPKDAAAAVTQRRITVDVAGACYNFDRLANVQIASDHCGDPRAAFMKAFFHPSDDVSALVA